MHFSNRQYGRSKRFLGSHLSAAFPVPSAKFSLLIIPFGYTAMRYYSKPISLVKYLLTEFLLLCIVMFGLGFVEGVGTLMIAFFTFYSVYDILYIDNDYFAKRPTEIVRSRESLKWLTSHGALLLFRFKLLICSLLLGVHFTIVPFASMFPLVVVVVLFIILSRTEERVLRFHLFVFLAFTKFLGLSFMAVKSTILDGLLVCLLVLPFIVDKSYEYVCLKSGWPFVGSRCKAAVVVSFVFCMLAQLFHAGEVQLQAWALAPVLIKWKSDWIKSLMVEKCQ